MTDTQVGISHFDNEDALSDWLLTSASDYSEAIASGNLLAQATALSPIPFNSALTYEEMIFQSFSLLERQKRPMTRSFLDSGVAMALAKWSPIYSFDCLARLLALGSLRPSAQVLHAATVLIRKPAALQLDAAVDGDAVATKFCRIASVNSSLLASIQLLDLLCEAWIPQSQAARAAFRLARVASQPRLWLGILISDYRELAEMQDCHRSGHLEEVVDVVGFRYTCRELVGLLIANPTPSFAQRAVVRALVAAEPSLFLLGDEGICGRNGQFISFSELGVGLLSHDEHSRLMDALYEIQMPISSSSNFEALMSEFDEVFSRDLDVVASARREWARAA